MLYEAPWWLVAPPPDTPPLPWSGEVVPIDVPPVPVDVPIAGPALQFIGKGEHAVWNDVWGWIKGGAGAVKDGYNQLATAVITDVVNIVETYVGHELQAFSGFVNRSFDYTKLLADSLAGAVSGTWTMAQTGILYLDGAVYAILAEVGAIDNIVIPGLEAELRKLGIDTWNLVGGAVSGVEGWAIDNIWSPLDAEIRRVESAIPVWSEGAYERAQAYADDLVHNEALKRAAAIAGIAAAVSALTTFVDECGQPMCDTMGPKTDLGKLLKGLKLAGEIAALTAILQMNEQDLANLIHAVTSHLAAVVGDIEQFTGTGGETVAGLIAAATRDLV